MPTSAIADQIITLSSDIVRWLLTWSSQTLLLLGVVWITLRFDRSQSPSIRYRIWLISFLAVILLPVLTVVSDRLHLPAPATPFPIDYRVGPPVFTSVTGVSARTIPWQSLLWPALLAVWAIGVFVSLLRLGNSLRKLGSIQKHANRISLTDLDCACPDLASSEAEKALILLSDKVKSPGLGGLFRPMVLLPADINAWTTREERTSILRHELAHIRRRDHLVSLGQMLLKAVLFFHPMVRYGCNQLSLERELACDDSVIDQGGEPSSYAESILKAAERSMFADVVHRAVSFASRRTFERRIDMILDPNRLNRPAGLWKFLLLPCLTIAFMTWFVIPSAAGRSSIQGAISPTPESLASDSNVGSSPLQNDSVPVVDSSRIFVDAVKRGSLVFQVRGLGTVVLIGNAFEAKIQIPEPQSRGIQVGQPVTIDTRQALVAGKVIAVSSQINNGVVEVEASLESNPSANLKAGLTIDGLIEVGRSEETLYVGRPVHGRPNSAATLFRLDEGGATATRVSVKLGRSSVSTIEIVDGLKVGDKVIVSDMGDYEGAALIKLK